LSSSRQLLSFGSEEEEFGFATDSQQILTQAAKMKLSL
jgi:hypothetical protein